LEVTKRERLENLERLERLERLEHPERLERLERLEHLEHLRHQQIRRAVSGYILAKRIYPCESALNYDQHRRRSLAHLHL
jgi:hypothetical protein